MPTYLRDAVTPASQAVIDQSHRDWDTQFYGSCPNNSLWFAESYAVAQNNKWPFVFGDTKIEDNRCRHGPGYIDSRYKYCMDGVDEAKRIREGCDDNWRWSECGWGDYTGSFYWRMKQMEKYGPGHCANQKEEDSAEVLGIACDHTDFSITTESGGHPCASVGDIYSNLDFKIIESSSEELEKQSNKTLKNAKVDFLAPMISGFRYAYFLAGSIIGAWEIYLNAKSETKTYAEKFLSYFPPYIPLVQKYGSRVGGAPS